MHHLAHNRIRVAAVQYSLRPITSFEQFADQVTATIESAAGYRCQLVVLPEYFTTQLCSLQPLKQPIHEMIREVARRLPQFVELMQGLARAHSLYIVAGTIPVVEDDKVFNDCYVFAPSGEYAIQGKLHMTRFEREDWKVSPRNRLRIFDTQHGKLAVAICYDVEFPELVRAAAQRGAHLLAVPSNTDDRQGFLRVRYCAHARTIENQMYVIHAPLVGALPRVPDLSLNYGQAAILTPSDFPFARDGVLSEGVLNQEGMIIGELSLGLIEESRTFGTVIPLEDSKHTRELVSDLDLVTL